MKVSEVINAVKKKTGVTGIDPEKTCDQLIIGDPDMEVKKVATTFMATVDVIRRAAREGANLIITHEPTWYTGTDKLDWIEDDPVYQKKKALLEEYDIAVWRFHDHMHMEQGDGIYRGFEKEFGWGEMRMDPPEDGDPVLKFGACYKIPQTTIGELSRMFREKLQMEAIRIVGEPDSTVSRVGVLVGGSSIGFGGDEAPVIYMQKLDLDVIVCGDIIEWSLTPYVRDANAFGMGKGMIVLGHERSEEPGMKYLPEWMESFMGNTEVIFLDAGEPFRYL